MTRFDPSAPAPDSPFFVAITMGGSPDAPTWSAVVGRGLVLERRRATEAANMLYWLPDNLLTSGIPTRFAAGTGYAIYVEVNETIPSGEIDSVTIVTGATNLQTVETAGSNVCFRYKLAEFEYDANNFLVAKPFLMGGHIYHWPEGKGLNLKVVTWAKDASGNWEPKSSAYDITHYWRKGDYVGKVDPGTTPDETQEISKLEP